MFVTVYSNDNSIDWEATGTDRIIQNVKNIIRTRRFEVPFIPLMGVNHEFIDALPQKIKSELSTHIKEVVNTYEPRVNVVDVRVESCDENGDYVVAVDLEV